MKIKHKKQVKGLFKRCKACKGYGYIDKLVEAPSMDDLPHHMKTRFRVRCEDCSGTGQVTWIQHMMGK
jgi:DnaJ-class molecular chaperone